MRPAIGRFSRAIAIAGTLLVIAFTPSVARAQRPGSGWILKPSPDGSIQTLYWDLYKQTEIWMRLEPRLPSGDAAPMYVVLSTIVDGQRQRKPVEAFDWQAQGNPRLIVTRPSFTLTLDGRDTIDLQTGAWPFHTLYATGCDTCAVTGAVAQLPVPVARRIASASRLEGLVLGLTVTFTREQIAALGRYIARVTLADAGEDAARPGARP